ncbi:hypothetical protein [Mesorhizobium sp. B1-1-8]|uniref:hypothetical protein n=1 Tax=Mesorhizobium sp. B1-1-8 TaxID=2589976 RepID=UPI00112B1CD4|nr:hypothetical protein [Mesorhizobium sp. B1-1-8]UCI06846.1 hypothetical protein FJ974_24070 [Mesorhizobium sp. B1-1-8]
MSVAVIYLVRGADGWWRSAADTFLASYRSHDSGAAHLPFVILKGFPDAASLAQARALFAEQAFEIIHLPDDGFDIGAYAAAARLVKEDHLCFFNTHSEILGHRWLAKFMVHLSAADVGLVGATGSYESLRPLSRHFLKFPNVHVRSNAFAIERMTFCSIVEGVDISSKRDAYRFESGRRSLTRLVLKRGKRVVLVGRNGRAFPPEWWPFSGTFRQGLQENLLVADNMTRAYESSTWLEKEFLVQQTWGRFVREENYSSDLGELEKALQIPTSASLVGQGAAE